MKQDIGKRHRSLVDAEPRPVHRPLQQVWARQKVPLIGFVKGTIVTNDT